MDRYVTKSDVSHFGLESLDTDLLIKNKVNRESNDYDIKVAQFKKYMTNKINKFDPLNVKTGDKLLELLWLSFIFNNVPPEKQKDLYMSV
mgnify:FL=1